MYTLRARFGKDIIAEFLPPARPSNKVMILCDGMPSIPNKKAWIEFFSKKGYWTFHPRYSGSWESSGKLLKRSPHQDVLDLIKQLPKGFKSEWDGTRYKLVPEKVIVAGSSFGGTTALMCALDSRVHKAIAISPVIDWRLEKHTVEPIPELFSFIKRAFGEGYRVDAAGPKKLASGKFFNPINHLLEFDKNKLLLIQAMDDEVVVPESTKQFAQKIGAELLTYKNGGHLGLSVLNKKKAWKIFSKHIKKKIR